jgi:hypothetical protein
MNEINYIINFVNKYYNNFIYESIDTMDEKINKSIMFLIYLLIIFIVLGSNLRTMPVALIILLIFIKHVYIKEEFDPEKKCRLPTIDNPFMNPLYEVDNLEACDATDKEILTKYYHNLPRNMNDVFDAEDVFCRPPIAVALLAFAPIEQPLPPAILELELVPIEQFAPPIIEAQDAPEDTPFD